LFPESPIGKHPEPPVGSAGEGAALAFGDGDFHTDRVADGIGLPVD